MCVCVCVCVAGTPLGRVPLPLSLLFRTHSHSSPRPSPHPTPLSPCPPLAYSYTIAGFPQVKSPWLLFFGRLIQGIWTGGQQAVEQTFLSAHVQQKHRTSVTASLGTSAVVGFVTGPAFATVLGFIDVKIG